MKVVKRYKFPVKRLIRASQVALAVMSLPAEAGDIEMGV